MKKIITFLVFGMSILYRVDLNAQTSFRFFDNEMFYRGYSPLSMWNNDTIVTKPAAANVIRLKTSLITKKLTDSMITLIGDRLTLKVLLKAACDNYDRGGHITLVMAKKGDTTYSTPGAVANVTKIELARFITPFMNKNKNPDTVPYIFEANNVAMMLKEKSMRDSFDLWMELEIFGVPDVAWTQVAGCGSPNRYDVFYASLDFSTSGNYSVESNNIIIPVTNQYSITTYKAGQSDIVVTGSDTTRLPAKTFTYTLPRKSYFTRAFVITSSHGAGTGGEEYNRRQHYVYSDGNRVFEYLPGFETCEPYRKYNTQANGIYGSSTKTPEQWQSFSNWCPGAYVPTRIIDLGILEAGTHTIKLDVPDAQFSNSDDKVQTSIYIQGKNEPYTGISNADGIRSDVFVFPNPANDIISISADALIKELAIVNIVGKAVWQGKGTDINVSSLADGLYYIKVLFDNGQYTVKPFVKK